MQRFSMENDLQLYPPHSYNKNNREEANYTWRTESRIAGVNLELIDTNVVHVFNAISCTPLEALDSLPFHTLDKAINPLSRK